MAKETKIVLVGLMVSLAIVPIMELLFTATREYNRQQQLPYYERRLLFVYTQQESSVEYYEEWQQKNEDECAPIGTPTTDVLDKYTFRVTYDCLVVE